MAPAASDPQSHLNYILSALTKAGAVSIKWDEVAAENNIGYARNAAAKFKDIVRKHGFSYENNKFAKADVDDTDGPVTPGTPASPQTPKTPRSGKRNADRDLQGQTASPSDGKSSASRKEAKRRKLAAAPKVAQVAEEPAMEDTAAGSGEDQMAED